MAAILECVKKDGQEDFHQMLIRYTSAVTESTLESQKNHLKDLLGRYLIPNKVKPIEGEYEREELLVEMIHNTICHGALKGLNITDVNTMVIVMIEGTLIIAKTTEKGNTNEEILKLLHEYSTSFSTQYGLQITLQYLIDTLIVHYNLYRYLMTSHQELIINSSSLPICIPPVNVLPLKESMIEEEWFRQERLGAVETQYRDTVNDMRIKREAVMREERERMELLYTSLNDSLEDREESGVDELKSVIDPLVKSHVAGVENELLSRLQEDESELTYYIDKITASRGGRKSAVPQN